jgi:hypothetical protein
MADSRYSGYPGDLTEAETLARLSVEEKRRVAGPAIKEFPHLGKAAVSVWLEEYGCEADTPPGAGALELVDVLLDCLERRVRSGERPEALDHFIYGHLYPAALEQAGVDPDEFVGREPLDEWEGVYGD